MLYTRNVNNPPEKIVQKGKAIFGDFNSPPRWLSIQHLKQPFSIMPLPNFITKSRIRTNLGFSFVFEGYEGSIEIVDGIYFCFAEIILLDKDSKRKFSYRLLKIKPRTIPVSAQKVVIRCSKKSRFILIKWDYEKDLFSIVCKVDKDRLRPCFHFAFSADLSKEKSGTLVSVVPCPTQRRCCATHSVSMQLEGSIAPASAVLTANPFVDKGLGLLSVRRSFYNLRTLSESIVLQGFVNGKSIQLTLYTSTQEAVDSDVYNENVLFVDNKTTPLPPVKITHPKGVKNKWIVQDTESMVDLIFSPAYSINRANSIFVLRTAYTFLLGTCEGTVTDKKGESYPIKGMSAIAKKIYLRM